MFLIFPIAVAAIVAGEERYGSGPESTQKAAFTMLEKSCGGNCEIEGESGVIKDKSPRQESKTGNDQDSCCSVFYSVTRKVQARLISHHFSRRCSRTYQPERKLYATVDWTQAKYYDTSKAVVVGTNLYYITRVSDGLVIKEYSTTTSMWRTLSEYSWLTDADGWDVEMRYATIRAASVGSFLYVFGRGGTGTYLSQLDPSTDTWTLMPTFAFITDAGGFNQPQFYQTVRMVSCGTALYITCRGNNRINIAKFETSTSTWTLLPALNQFTSDAVWNVLTYYSTFRLAVSGSMLWLYGRDSAGSNIVSFNTVTNTWGSLLSYAYFTNTGGWTNPIYYDTLELLTLNTKIYVFSRGSATVYELFYDTSTSGFTVGNSYSGFTDSTGWNVAMRYQTMKFTACNNVVYLVGRGSTALTCAKYSANAWAAFTNGNNMFEDSNGWNNVYNYRSLRCVCIGNSLYYVGRKGDTVQISVYSTAANSWNPTPVSFYPCSAACKDCSGSLSTSCTQCFPLSHLQSASPSACVCDSHYFPDPNPPTCSSCHAHCAECSGSSVSQCTACAANSALVASPVSECKCNTGFYRDANSVCAACHQRCRECSGPAINQCTDCMGNSHLLSSPLSECICDSGFYFDGFDVCTGCYPTCRECSAGIISTCTQCKSNSSLTNPPISPCSCDSGYYMNSSSDCIQCHPSCSACTGSASSLCTSCPTNSHLASSPISSCDCDSGYYYDTAVELCQQCHPSCLECSGVASNMCIQCPVNSYLSSPPTSTCDCSSGYFMNASSICATCDPTCTTCISGDSQSCSQCAPNSELANPPISACGCLSSYYRDINNSCTQCHPRCIECSGPAITQCTECRDNAQLASAPVSECKCNTGLYFNSLELCDNCDASCLECAGGGVSSCTQCKVNAVLQTPPSSACQCTSGYYVEAAGDCQQCGVRCSSCISADSSQCTQCIANAHLVVPPTSCCECDDGYTYSIAAGICVLCNALCLSCIGPARTDCLSCKGNLVLSKAPEASECVCPSHSYRSSPDLCSPCHNTCDSCSGPGSSQCTQCQSFATIQDTGECLCSPSYFWNSTTSSCQQCHASCIECSGSSQQQCFKCYPNASRSGAGLCRCIQGYYPAAGSTASCQPCPLLCASCVDPGECVKCTGNAVMASDGVCECNSGYFSQSESISCSKCLSGCKICSSANDCVVCEINLVLYSDRCLESCPAGFIASRAKCVPEPPIPSLSVAPDNVLTLTFSPPVTKQLESADFTLSVPDLDGQSIPLSWSTVPIEPYQTFNISLIFYQTTPPDNSTLYLLFLHSSDFHDESGTAIQVSELSVTLYPIAENTALSAVLAPINTPAATTASTVSQGGVASAAAMSVVGGNPTALFGLLNQLQIITYIPLMEIDLPDELLQTMVGLNSNGFSVNVFDGVFPPDRKATKPNSTASKYGYTSTLFLKNSAFTVVSLACVVIAYLVVTLLAQVTFVPVIAIYFTEIREKFQWSVPLRLWIQLYLDVGVNSLLQYTSAGEFDYQWDIVLNASVSAVLLSLFAVTPIFVISLINRHQAAILHRSDPDLNRKWGVLYMEFRESARPEVYQYYVLFILRRFLYALSLILFTNAPITQLTVNLLMSLAVRSIQVVLLLVLYRPYAHFTDQVGALLSEFTTLLVFSIAFTFPFVKESAFRSKLSTACKVAIFTGIGGNAILSVYEAVITIHHLLTRFKEILLLTSQRSLAQERLFARKGGNSPLSDIKSKSVV